MKRKRVSQFVLLLISAIIVLCAFILFLPRYKKNEKIIKIEALGIINENALGDGLQIMGVSVDGKSVPLSDFFDESQWDYSDGKYTWNGWLTCSNEITAKKVFRSAEITFLTNPYCGSGNIYIDNQLIETKDFYSVDNGVYKFKISGTVLLPSIIRILIYTLGVCIVYLCINRCIKCFAVKWNNINYNIKVLSIIFIIIIAFIISLQESSLIRFICTFIICISCALLLLLLIYINDIDIKANSKYIRKMLYYIFLSIAIIYPLIFLLCNIENVNETYNNIDFSNSIVLSNNTKIKQKINVEGNFNNFKVYIANEEYSQGSLKIFIKDHLNEEYFEFSAEEIKNKDFLNIPISLDYKRYPEIIIECDNFEDSKGLKIYLGKDNIFGACTIESEGTTYASDGNLCMEINCSKELQVQKANKWLISILIILTIISFCFLERNNSTMTFIITSAIIIIAIAIRFPQIIFFSEPIAEGGSNFFFQTYTRGILKTLMLDDYHYWPLFPRLLAWIAISITRSPKYTILAMNLLMCLLVALICSAINLKSFNRVTNKYVRFAISIILGMSINLMNIESISYNNAGYWFIILYFLILVSDLENISKWRYCLILITNICFITKAHFLIIFPTSLFAIIMIYILKKQKEKKRLLLYLINSLLASMLVGGYLFLHSAGMLNQKETLFTQVFLAIKRGVYILVQCFLTFHMSLFRSDWGSTNGILMNSFILALIVIGLAISIKEIIVHSEKKKTLIASCYFFTILFAFCSCVFLSFTHHGFQVNYSWNQLTFIDYGRNQLFIYIAIVFNSLCVMAWLLYYGKKYAAYTLCALVIINQFSPKIYSYNTNYLRSNWNQYYVQLNEASYVIPIFGDRFIQKEGEIFYYGNKSYVDTSVWNYTYGVSSILTNHDADKERISNIYFEDSVMEDRKILSIYADKIGIMQNGDAVLILKDREGHELARVSSTYSEERKGIGFLLSGGISNVSTIQFVDSMDNPYYVMNDIYIGVEKLANH